MRGSYILLLLLGLMVSSHTQAHEFYFCYAETEYNEMSQKFEVTIVATAHDIEKALSESGSLILDELAAESENYQIVENYLNDHFSISGTDPSTSFSLIGIEVDLNGTARFYLESNEIIVNENISITFDLMMDQFKEQQNKLTFIHRGRSKTIVFLQHQQNQEIDLSKL